MYNKGKKLNHNIDTVLFLKHFEIYETSSQRFLECHNDRYLNYFQFLDVRKNEGTDGKILLSFSIAFPTISSLKNQFKRNNDPLK